MSYLDSIPVSSDLRNEGKLSGLTAGGHRTAWRLGPETKRTSPLLRNNSQRLIPPQACAWQSRRVAERPGVCPSPEERNEAQEGHRARGPQHHSCHCVFLLITPQSNWSSSPLAAREKLLSASCMFTKQMGFKSFHRHREAI